MALSIKGNSSLKGARGAADATWQKLDFGFDAKSLKIIVWPTSPADLEISVDGTNVLAILPKPEANQNPMQYDFQDMSVSRLYVQGAGAIVEIIASTS